MRRWCALLILAVLVLAKPKTDNLCYNDRCFITAHPDDKEPQQVPGLESPTIWIGNEYAARNCGFMRDQGIEFVVSMIERDWDDCENVTYLEAEIDDTSFVIITPSIHRVHGWLNTLEPSSQVLVHCAAGVSRSATIVLGHMLLRDHLLTLDTALERLQSARSVVNPNPGFMRELYLLERNRVNK